MYVYILKRHCREDIFTNPISLCFAIHSLLMCHVSWGCPWSQLSTTSIFLYEVFFLSSFLYLVVFILSCAISFQDVGDHGSSQLPSFLLVLDSLKSLFSLVLPLIPFLFYVSYPFKMSVIIALHSFQFCCSLKSLFGLVLPLIHFFFYVTHRFRMLVIMALHNIQSFFTLRFKS